MIIKIEVEDSNPRTNKVYRTARQITDVEFFNANFDIVDQVTRELIGMVQKAMSDEYGFIK